MSSRLPEQEPAAAVDAVATVAAAAVDHAAEAAVEQLNAEAKQILDDMTVRKRRPWNSDGSLGDGHLDLDLLDIDDDGLDDEDEEEDGVGCPLPSTPEDNQLLEAEVSDE